MGGIEWGLKMMSMVSDNDGEIEPEKKKLKRKIETKLIRKCRFEESEPLLSISKFGCRDWIRFHQVLHIFTIVWHAKGLKQTLTIDSG